MTSPFTPTGDKDLREYIASAVVEAIGGEALTRVEDIEATGDDLNVTVRLTVPKLPVTAEVGPATATFDPRGDR